MDKLKTLVSLNEMKDSIEDMITRINHGQKEKKDESSRLLVIVLCVLGSLAIIGAVAYLVYRHFSDDYLDDYEDLDDLFDDEDEDEDADDEDDGEDPEVIASDDDFEDEFED